MYLNHVTTPSNLENPEFKRPQNDDHNNNWIRKEKKTTQTNKKEEEGEGCLLNGIPVS